jgi:outer membrane protein assembly factor BamB
MILVRIVVLILSACVVPVAWSQQPASTVQTNWSEFRRPNMKRWNPYEKVLNVNTVPHLGVKWTYTTGNVVSTSPAVVNGVVYVDSSDGNLYALNADTGVKLWSYNIGDSISSPAVANGVVYVGSLGEFGKLYALNARTGTLLWSFNAGDSVCDPTVVHGVVYFSSNSNYKLYALNARTASSYGATTREISCLTRLAW